MNQHDRIYQLLHEVQAGTLSVEAFCGQYETTYNFHLDKSALSETERRLFSDLFDKTIWYSPFPEERKKIPNYISESDVMAAVNETVAQLAARK